MLKNAKKPLFLIGGGVNISHANEEFEKLYKILSKYKMIDEKKFLKEESTQKMERK